VLKVSASGVVAEKQRKWFTLLRATDPPRKKSFYLLSLLSEEFF